jgi:NADH-quinone oxidoreductase subunit C
MENEVIINKIKENFADHLLSVDLTSDILTLVVDKSVVFELIQMLKDDIGFGFLTSLCGIHYPDRELPLGVVYHLHNLQENKRIRLKAFVPFDKPEIKSIVEIYSGANWMERETYDFYGIIFEGHPNLIRILNVEYLDYFPMRKEYPLEDSTRRDKDDKFFGR